MQFLSNIGIDVGNIIEHELYQPKNILELVSDFILGIISTFSNFALVFLLVVFMLIDTAGIRYKINKGEKELTEGLAKSIELADEIRKYVSITSLVGFLGAIGNFILLMIMGVDFAVLWAFLSFLFNYVPNIGIILSVIPPAFIAFGDSGMTAAIIVIVGFVIINGIVENIVKPRFIGKKLHISLTSIFLSLVFWTWILGAMGAVLAIPLTISAMKARDIFISE